MAGRMLREDVFFDLLDRAAENAHAGARALCEWLHHFTEPKVQWERLQAIEKAGDALTREVITRLQRAIITPFDREDIHAIASRIDDVLDYIESAGERIISYGIRVPTEDAKRMCLKIVEATNAVVDAVAGLRTKRRDVEGLLKKCIAIHGHENATDELVHAALAALFRKESATEIIKWKDIYMDLESSADACDSVAHALETVVLKSA